MAEFGSTSSQIRIVFATEVLGLGVDLNDVVNVYQYGLLVNRSLCVIWQRAGRAARGFGLRGTFTFFVEASLLCESDIEF